MRPGKPQRRTRETRDPSLQLPSALVEQLGDQPASQAAQPVFSLRQKRRQERKQKRKRKGRHPTQQQPVDKRRKYQTALSKVEPPSASAVRHDHAQSASNTSKRKKDSQSNKQGTTVDSSPVATVDQDEVQSKHLETLLGIGRAKNGRKAKSYLDVFGEEEEDLLDLVQFCDNTVQQPANGARADGSDSKQMESPSDSEHSLPGSAHGHGNSSTDDEIQPVRQASDNESEEDGPAYTSGRESEQEDGIEGSTRPRQIASRATEEISPILASDENEQPQSADEQGNPQSSDEANIVEKPFRFKRRSGLATRDEDKGDMAKRKMRGLLNRVSIDNAHDIAKKLVAIFDDAHHHLSRRQLAQIYAATAFDCVASGGSVRVQNPFISAHIAIMKFLGTTIDALVTATCVVEAVRRLKKSFATEQHRDSNNWAPSTRLSEAMGYISAISSMYKQGVVSSRVVYDVIRFTGRPLDESRLELLLLALRQIGPHLRKEDPSAVKHIIEFVHSQVGVSHSAAGEDGEGDTYDGKQSVLIDLLNEIKDNRMRSKSGNDKENLIPSRSLLDPFDASVDDLLDEGFTSSRWWEFGKDLKPVVMGKGQKGGSTENDKKSASAKLLSSLKITSQLKKAIFFALMNSSNPADAFNRLDTLGCVRGQNELRDTAHIILLCCGRERGYNSFYALVGKKICASRDGRFAMEFAIFNAVKALVESGQKEESSSRKARNYALFASDLWECEALPLSMLRRIPDFDECSVSESAFLFSAVENLLNRVTSGGHKGGHKIVPFESLAAEKWKGAQAFRLSFATFMRRNVCPKLATDTREVATRAIRVLEVES